MGGRLCHAAAIGRARGRRAQAGRTLSGDDDGDSPGMGLSWGNGRLGDNYIDYKFRVEALTLNEWNDRFAVSGQQVTLYGNVYHLVHVPDFAGTYTEATPAVTSAVGGPERSRVYQNDKGVLVRITGRFVPGAIGMGEDFDVRLLKDNFTITFRDF
jgi:hypothetical protein